ncbi:MAG: D-lyxose/D-mannose family sugar isomerase [Terracidiphilus sp.]
MQVKERLRRCGDKFPVPRKRRQTGCAACVSLELDIINRGGMRAGRLAVQLYNSDEDGGFAQTPVSVVCNGIRRTVEAGSIVILGSGESITLTPYLYHMFYAVEGDGLIGEVSSVNDDDADNHFKDPLPRYPEIVEDEPPARLLCTEYSTIAR